MQKTWQKWNVGGKNVSTLKFGITRGSTCVLCCSERYGVCVLIQSVTNLIRLNWINSHVKSGARQTKHIITDFTPSSWFISICLLSYYMKHTQLRLSELIWPKSNGFQVLSDNSNVGLYTLLAIQKELHLWQAHCVLIWLATSLT